MKQMIRRIIFIILGIHFSVCAFSQTLTVEQLESKWKNLYLKGCRAFDAGNYTFAKQYLTDGIELLSSNQATNSKYHIYALIKLGEAHYKSKNASELEITNNKLLDVKTAIRPGSKRHIEYLYNLGVYYSGIKRTNDAIKVFDEALSYQETLQSMESYRSKILHYQSLCYYWNGDLKQAISLEKDAISNDFNKTPDYVQALAFYYYKSQDWSNLNTIIKSCYNNSREPVLRKFYQSKATDRATYWSRAGLFFTDFLPSYAFTNPSPELVSYTYDAALFSKGILLAAENKSSEMTLNSDDPELVKLYERYLELKDKKNKTLDEKFEMEALSDVVLRHQKENKNEYRKDFRITWTDVQAKLNTGDVAIEFITIPSPDGNDNYAALIITKEVSAPKLIKLGNFKKFASIPSENIYTTSQYYELVWGPLETYIQNAKNIYFSPAGIFCNTAIEYLPDENDININATHKVWRLSSTKELVLSKPTSYNTCALFGGINYDTKPSVMSSQSPNYKQHTDQEKNISLDSLDLRGATTSGGFTYLEGTMEEIGNISMTCLDADIQADMYCDDEGSETTFKNLTGSSVDILHIATHGFYYANQNIGKRVSLDNTFNRLFRNSSNEYFQPLNEDKMLTRSGLILAGANNTLKRIKLPVGVEDGILYANEAANLNLSKTDLLVLSACQSGLGDIASSEGVFGLQRGFKLAGVNSIIMSLWKVNDEATQILMSSLYENIAAGQTTREALTNAQLSLRTTDAGRFDYPEFWAGFILLDGLN